jgi:hypothetical protein
MHLVLVTVAALYGNGTEIMNEKAYVVGIPPCLWGSEEEGLLPPPKIHLDTNLTTIKRTNSTNGHWGVMALWQSRGSYLAEKPPPSAATSTAQ